MTNAEIPNDEGNDQGPNDERGSRGKELQPEGNGVEFFATREKRLRWLAGFTTPLRAGPGCGRIGSATV